MEDYQKKFSKHWFKKATDIDPHSENIELYLDQFISYYICFNSLYEVNVDDHKYKYKGDEKAATKQTIKTITGEAFLYEMESIKTDLDKLVGLIANHSYYICWDRDNKDQTKRNEFFEEEQDLLVAKIKSNDI